jgi:hypothetical protein
VRELEQYLGERFDPALLRWRDTDVVDELRQYKDAREYRRRSKLRVYRQAHLGESSWRKPYLQFVREVCGPTDVLDYHCGVGSFGLRLQDDYGYRANFADERGECIKFLKWRIEQRGAGSRVYDIDKDEIPRHSLAICFDKILLYPPEQQLGAIKALAVLADVVILNLNTQDFNYDGFYYPVDVEVLAGQIKQEFELIRQWTVNYTAHLFAIRGTDKADDVAPEPVTDEPDESPGDDALDNEPLQEVTTNG